MTTHLTLRLTEAESKLVERLHVQTGLSKSALVKQALQRLSAVHEASAEGGLFALGAKRFGRHGDAARQSASIKSVVRERLNAKHAGRSG
jgi:plasmid maintenance system killer protein